MTNKEGKGTRDTSILARAEEMEKQLKEDQRNGENSMAFKRSNLYSKQGLLPEEILQLIPYKQTYEALQGSDEDGLKALLSPFVRFSMQAAYNRFDQIESKREKKTIMKAHVYLDALITLHRLP